jgi:hypothetical protein
LNRIFKEYAGVIMPAVFCVFLLLVLTHTVQNLLSYDEGHSIGHYGNTIEMGEEGTREGTEESKWKIVVNLDEYNIYVYNEGALVKTYRCSGGKAATPSPTGNFKIVVKDEWGEGFGGSWMGLDVPWGTYGIHGTIFPWVIGKYHASKGCIRMLRKDADELFHLVPYGTDVEIIQSSRKFRALGIGDVGSDVRDMEETLKSLGYYKGALDGRFGQKLFNAIVEFQKDNGLKDTGTLNQKTFELAKKMSAELEKNGEAK